MQALGQLPAQRRERAVGPRREQAGAERSPGEGDDEQPEQHGAHRGQQQPHSDHRGGRHHGRDQHRLHDPQRHVLLRVDVCDHTGDEITAPDPAEPVRRHGHEPLVDAGAQLGQCAEGRVVPGEPLQVAEERPRQRERAHADHGHREEEDRRLLRRAHDQPGRAGEQRHDRGRGQQPEGQPGDEAPR
ncbi:hypothetical protein [Rathayibacter sp. VKM Ac-2760]|uniref:hypothetical protein n=1 Tax=Rathayibacter sp. VKM Ac-2760 TaxID=2609253 RepID=UPI001FC9A43D|nr:hypothetical protein [Rathayibacter sp. VKM Ac-2760]